MGREKLPVRRRPYPRGTLDAWLSRALHFDHMMHLIDLFAWKCHTARGFRRKRSFRYKDPTRDPLYRPPEER